LITLCAD